MLLPNPQHTLARLFARCSTRFVTMSARGTPTNTTERQARRFLRSNNHLTTDPPFRGNHYFICSPNNSKKIYK